MGKATNHIREKMLAHGMWIERSMPLADVAALVAEIRPVANKRNLRRFGPAGDGGYLMPDDLDGVSGCISPGVSTEVGFDLEIADRGIDVYQVDASVSGPPVHHPRFHFTKKFLDSYNSENTITLDDYCGGIGHDCDLILQMDIEGAEYRVLNSTSHKLLRRFRIMVIEFHDLEHLFSPVAFREMSSVFRKLHCTHEIIHIHPNNVASAVRVGELEIPRLLEFTFYRRDRDDFESKPLQFPHPLDADNVQARPSIVLPRCWHPTGYRAQYR